MSDGGEADGGGGGGGGGGGKRRRRRGRGGGGGGEQQVPPPQQPQQQRESRPPQQQREPRPPQQQREPRPPRERPTATPTPATTLPLPLPSTLPTTTMMTSTSTASLASAVDEDDEPVEKVAWGTDDGAAAPDVVLAADLPVEVDDPDPVTVGLDSGLSAMEVGNLVGVRFAVGGRVSWLDSGELDYTVGERVLADSDRGPRVAVVAVAPARRPIRERNPRRVIRRATDADDERDDGGALRIAKDAAAECGLPLKVFRVESGKGKLVVYYTSDEQRLDVRELVRVLSKHGRVELRQLGARDEAKQVGGIGTCGLTLCCTTWLPDFVPVSIKMAKDQGLVLAPNKIAGQCGRLKCCLVYEQAGYAEMRKGLPKLGKRVVTARGEGRVVEVDVLRQRIRVSYAPGETEVLPAAEVKPMFPPGSQAPEPEPPEPDEPEPDIPS